MTLRDNKEYLRVLAYSYYATITGWVPLSYVNYSLNSSLLKGGYVGSKGDYIGLYRGLYRVLLKGLTLNHVKGPNMIYGIFIP